jgi:lysyl-tRNA synthetase class 1
MEKAKLTGLYQYCWMLKPPEEPSVHAPYNLMTKLARVAPKGSEHAFMEEKLREYGYLDTTEKGLEERIRYALNWVEDFEESSQAKVELSQEEVRAIRALIVALDEAEGEEQYQSTVFDAARAEGIKPRNLFQILYRILLGRSYGPRFGPYVALMGKENVIKEFKSAIENKE